MTRAGTPAPDDAARARAVRGLALAARSLEQAAGDLTLAQYRVLAFVAAGTLTYAGTLVDDGTLANGRVFWPSAASGMMYCWEPTNKDVAP